MKSVAAAAVLQVREARREGAAAAAAEGPGGPAPQAAEPRVAAEASRLGSEVDEALAEMEAETAVTLPNDIFTQIKSKVA